MRVLSAGAIALVLFSPAADPARAAGASGGGQAEAGIREVVAFLSSEELMGRGAGSAGLEKAAAFVRARFEAAGLRAGYRGKWRQEFENPSGGKLANIVGRLPGTGDRYVVLGAHYDGLGLGPEGSEHAGLVHPGADDNASGVAALVEIARRLAAGPAPERTIFFVAFSGEESGLLGSKAFVDDPPASLAKAVAMLNLDTVGRLEGGTLIVVGSGTAEEFPAILRGINYAFGFDLALRPEGSGASDHTPFFARGIPVLQFFTGAKPEYHRPGDLPELLVWEGIARIAEFATEVVAYLARSDVSLSYRPVGAERLEASGGRRGRPRRVSFGSIPDFAHDSGGVLLSGVMPESPAEAAGLCAGDLLVAMDGRPLETIYDLQEVLAAHEPGDTVSVRFRRGDSEREVRVRLQARRKAAR